MVCVHTYNESDNAFQRFGHLKFSKIAASRRFGFDTTGNGRRGSVDTLQSYGHLKFLQNL